MENQKPDSDLPDDQGPNDTIPEIDHSETTDETTVAVSDTGAITDDEFIQVGPFHTEDGTVVTADSIAADNTPDQESIPDDLLGDMVTVEATPDDMAIRLMCWHLTTSGMLGPDDALVYIEDDVEALDIAKRWNLRIELDEATGVYRSGLSLPNLDVILKDTSARMLLCRVIHFAGTRSDPPIQQVLQRVAEQIKAKETK